jgi:hypothetical protein
MTVDDCRLKLDRTCGPRIWGIYRAAEERHSHPEIGVILRRQCPTEFNSSLACYGKISFSVSVLIDMYCLIRCHVDIKQNRYELNYSLSTSKKQVWVLQYVSGYVKWMEWWLDGRRIVGVGPMTSGFSPELVRQTLQKIPDSGILDSSYFKSPSSPPKHCLSDNSPSFNPTIVASS